jgi:sulfite exporter TauE/SafE
MTHDLTVLAITAASLGFFHTLFGPDHYLPFIMMARARRWSLAKTGWITFLCGLGHIGSSVVLGLLGIALGVAVHRLVAIESFRGNIAAWLLIAFGLVYFAWGLRQAIRNKPHEHEHLHEDTSEHNHSHVHTHEHTHVHETPNAQNITPWVLFTIFVFGPCEPLIPILMYPAARSSWWGLLMVTLVFGGTTILTMMGLVLLTTFGINFLPLGKVERYTHAIAGAAITLCGAAIVFLGL